MEAKRYRRLLLLLGVALCAGPPCFGDADLPRTPLGAHFDGPIVGDAQPHDAARSPDLHGEIGLRRVLAAALLRNPNLGASAWEARVREARALQAGLLPNPSFDFEIENILGSGLREGVDQSETTVHLSQLVLLTDRRLLGRKVAGLRSELGRWDYEVARVDVLTQSTKAFVALLAAQLRLRLLEDFEQVVTAAIDLVAAQVRAGAAPPVLKTRAEVLKLSVVLDAAQARRVVAASRVALSATWGSSTPEFSSVRGDLRQDLTDPPPLQQLIDRTESNPDLARWATELSEREAVLSLANVSWIPNPTVRVAGRHFNDNDDAALVAGFSIPLPVFDRNQGAVLAATREVQKAKADKASAELSVRSMLARRYHELLAALEQARRLRAEAIPAALLAFEGTSEGYRRGTFDYLDVIAAQRMVFDLRSREIDALASYHLARADIERLMGAPLDAEEGSDEDR